MIYKLYYLEDGDYNFAQFDDTLGLIKYNYERDFRELSVSDIPSIIEMVRDTISYYNGLINEPVDDKAELFKKSKYLLLKKQAETLLEDLQIFPISVNYTELMMLIDGFMNHDELKVLEYLNKSYYTKQKINKKFFINEKKLCKINH